MTRKRFQIQSTIIFVLLAGFGCWMLIGTRILAKLPNQEKLNTVNNGPNQYNREVLAINAAADKISAGNAFYRQQRYEDAARAYEEAYKIGGGSRSVSGFKLVQSYEKLKQYNSALTLLDAMIEKNQLSKSGIQMAHEFKERLIAAKAQS